MATVSATPDGVDSRAGRNGYGTSKSEALRAYRDGLPSILPESNSWKSLVEAHRWGRHADLIVRSCPACCPAEVAS